MRIKYIVISLTVIGLLITGTKIVFAQYSSQEVKYKDLYVCSMHPLQASEGPSKCDICGMKLSQVYGHPPGTEHPGIFNLFVSKDKPSYIHEGKDNFPQEKLPLLPITESPFYEPVKTDASLHEGASPPLTTQITSEPALWTCGMHPDVISDEPGICPICNMDLVPLKKSSQGGSSVIFIDPVTVQNIGVVYETVELRNLSQSIITDGIVEPAEDLEYSVNLRVSGWAEKLYANKTGRWIKKDEPLLEIYSPELISAQEELFTSYIDFPSRNSDNLTSLSKSVMKKFEFWGISAAEIDSLLVANTIQRTMTILSPFTGFISEKKVIEGEFIKTGRNILKISDYRQVWIIAYVYEFELPWVKNGGKVKMRAVHSPEIEYEGMIDYIYPQIDSQTKSAEIRIVVSNNDLILKPGMFMEVEISAEPINDAISVSKQAVIRSGKRDIVFVSLGSGKFEPREVHLGLETDSCYQVLHNLNPGEKVVTSAQFLLDSEAKLQEAIQKRLQQRNRMKSSDPDSSPSDESDQRQHIH